MVVDLGGSRSWSAPPGRPDSRLLYVQVVAYVEELVAERGLIPGDMLPTYADLAASTGVSLITVRRALDELEKAGRVRRHQGRGTFLARPRIVTEKAGPAAVTSVIILFVIYSVVIMAFQGVAPNKAMQANAANILAYVGDLIGGGFWKNVMIVAVLGGTLASLQAAIVSSSRISFAMGRDRVFPRFLGQVNTRYHTPLNATILFGLLNLVFLWGATLIGPLGTALDDIASTLGLMAAIFYLLTASAAVWYYRRVIRSSTANLILGGFLPTLGAAFMLFVIIYSLASGDLDGIEIGFGFGFALVGLIISFIVARTGHAPFYTDPRSSHGPHIEEELAAPEPEAEAD